MLVYLSSYPRSGNSLLQDLISLFFQRPISGVEQSSILVRTNATKNWTYHGSPLTEKEEEIQGMVLGLRKKLTSRFNKYILRNYPLEDWIVTYELNGGSSFSSSNKLHTLLPGCEYILTHKNRALLAHSEEVFFVKSHQFPYKKYFDGEKVIQVVRHPSMVFKSYYKFLVKEKKEPPSLESVILGDIYCGCWSQWHLSWKKHEKDFFWRVRFEDILNDTKLACDKISQITGLNYDESARLTPFQELNMRDPNYYASGTSGRDNNFFDKEHIQLIRKIHGSIMRDFDYE